MLKKLNYMKSMIKQKQKRKVAIPAVEPHVMKRVFDHCKNDFIGKKKRPDI